MTPKPSPLTNGRPSEPRRWYQFGLGTLLFSTVLFSILAAALGGMLRGRAARGVPLPPGFFIMMAVAAPLAVMILLSLFRSVVLRIRRYRPRR